MESKVQYLPLKQPAGLKSPRKWEHLRTELKHSTLDIFSFSFILSLLFVLIRLSEHKEVKRKHGQKCENKHADEKRE